jgi:RNA polymerase sigma factor (sigma-70 family)
MSLETPDRSTLTDEELVSLYQVTGDAEYFALIFGRHRRLVFGACRRFFSCSGLAEDATQESFLRAYKGLRGFEGGNVRGWLMRIAKNVCIDLWRKQRPECQMPADASIDVPDPVNLDQTMEMNRALEKVQQEMKFLSPEQRDCLEMKMEGYSYEETAQCTSMSLDAVKSHLQNGRRMFWLRVRGYLSGLS